MRRMIGVVVLLAAIVVISVTRSRTERDKAGTAETGKENGLASGHTDREDSKAPWRAKEHQPDPISGFSIGETVHNPQVPPEVFRKFNEKFRRKVVVDQRLPGYYLRSGPSRERVIEFTLQTMSDKTVGSIVMRDVSKYNGRLRYGISDVSFIAVGYDDPEVASLREKVKFESFAQAVAASLDHESIPLTIIYDPAYYKALQ